MVSPLKSLCCFTNKAQEDEAPTTQNEAEVVIPSLPTSNPTDEVVVHGPFEVTNESQGEAITSDSPSDEVVTAEEATKGHKRTPSEVSPLSPVAVTANPPTPTKVSRCSSTSSYKSSTSVLTAIERTPGLVREESKESVVTAIERSPTPLVVKNDDEESKGTPSTNGMSSQESKVEDGADVSKEVKEENLKTPPVSPQPKIGVSSPESKGSKEEDGCDKPKASSASPAHKSDTSEAEGVPEDVTTLDLVNKLNELIDTDKYDLKHPFWDKISLFYGDITKINVDAIVNAANDRLGGGGGVDGAIHRAAGYNQLQAECRKHDRPVATGQAVITDACKLSTHVKKIIHCVGPICYGGVTPKKRNELESCYRRAIELSEENGLRSIAFCCISTGIYGYDNKDAARSVIKFLYKHLSKEENVEKWDRIVLCLFMDIDKQCYKHYITQLIRNPSLFDEDEEEESEDEDEKKKKQKNKENDENEKEDKEKDEKEDKEKDGKIDEDNKDKKKEGETTDEKDDDGKNETDGNVSSKTEDKGITKSPTDTVDKKTESTVEGEELKKDETIPSASETSIVEKTEKIEKQEGGQGDGDQGNSVIDGNEKEDGVSGKKRAPSEEDIDQPPIKRDKIERESSV